jgi:RHS repeat-associated protein
MAEIGLYHYGARFYRAAPPWGDPAIAHFISADTIVPSAGNVLDWNRYAYVRYNPLKYVDPSGHNPECGPDGMWCDSAGNLIQFQKLQLVNFKKYFGESKELEKIFSNIEAFRGKSEEIINEYGWLNYLESATFAMNPNYKGKGDNMRQSWMWGNYDTNSYLDLMIKEGNGKGDLYLFVDQT